MEWRPVSGYENRYEVSDTGLVRSVDHWIVRNGHKAFIRGRILKVRTEMPSGRILVGLYRGAGRYWNAKVHRLVLQAFVGPCPHGMECCHNDGNPANNHIDNLRWDTKVSNALDSVRHGTNFNARKTHCPKGHEYNPDNTRINRARNGKEGRGCKRCQNDYTVKRNRWNRMLARAERQAAL